MIYITDSLKMTETKWLCIYYDMPWSISTTFKESMPQYVTCAVAIDVKGHWI